ncbi:MAG: glycosyltransferase family 9 protein [Alistipes sp.]|nr:glycosyltransferase family 9 protein [Alistipes sp.]
MGDVAMLSHTIRAFKECYPDVKLTVVTRRLFAPFFSGQDVDFLFVDTKGEHKGFKGIWRLYRAICRLKVDAVADMHSVMRSSAVRTLCALSGYKVASIDKGKIEKWFRVGYNSRNTVPLKHTVVRYCDVLRKMGFEFENPAPAVKVARLNPMGEKSGSWVGFAPFSAHDGKTYPEDLRVELVRLMNERYDRVFIHSGGGVEAEFARRMEAEYDKVTALNGKVDLEGELNLMSHLDCIVSMDSLAMHMASIAATPVVSVWGATHPALGFLGYGCPEEGVLQEEMPCRPCSVYGNKPCESGDYKCLRAITPQMIVDKVDELISR